MLQIYAFPFVASHGKVFLLIATNWPNRKYTILGGLYRPVGVGYIHPLCETIGRTCSEPFFLTRSYGKATVLTLLTIKLCDIKSCLERKI